MSGAAIAITAAASAPVNFGLSGTKAAPAAVTPKNSGATLTPAFPHQAMRVPGPSARRVSAAATRPARSCSWA